jgi:hypothetical protein
MVDFPLSVFNTVEKGIARLNVCFGSCGGVGHGDGLCAHPRCAVAAQLHCAAIDRAHRTWL